MSSFIFNDFKERYIRGEVPAHDTWFAYPVTKKFMEYFDHDDMKVEQFKNTNQMDLYIGRSKNYHNATLSSTYADLNILPWAYTEVKNMDAEKDTLVKPTYVTADNWNSFISKYKTDNPELLNKFQKIFDYFFNGGQFSHRGGGFYWVTTKEELGWCANRVNGYADGEYTENYNNEINIVLGDDIGPGDAYTVLTKDEKGNDIKKDNRDVFKICIGKNANRPYQGIFYGNGYKIQNFIIECTTDCNGIFGYVGQHGVVCHVKIAGQNKMRCKQKLNMTHIKNSSTDVQTALLVGHNYGLVSYNDITGTCEIEDFIPAIYAVENKAEDTREPVGDRDENMHYPSYMCINSPGNLIPYIGYFNEGVIGSIRTYPQELTKVLNDKWEKAYQAVSDRVSLVVDHYWVITKNDGNASVDKYFTSYNTAREYAKKLYDFENNKGIEYLVPDDYDLIGYIGKKYKCPDNKPPLIVKEPQHVDYDETLNAFINADIDPATGFSAMQREKDYFSYVGNDALYSVGQFLGDHNNMLLYDYEATKYVASELLPTSDNPLRDKDFGFASHCNEENNTTWKMADEFSACPWIDVPTKLHQFSRAAYYISPLIGWSKGDVNHNMINVNVQFNNEFAGFAGGLMGKYAGGNCDDNHININVSDTYYRNQYVLSAADDVVNNQKQINMFLDFYTPACNHRTAYQATYTGTNEDGKTVTYSAGPYDLIDTTNPYFNRSNYDDKKDITLDKLNSLHFPYKKDNFDGTYLDVYDIQDFKFTSESLRFSATDVKTLNSKIYSGIESFRLKGKAKGTIPNPNAAPKETKTFKDYENAVLMANNFDRLQIYQNNANTYMVQSAHCYIPLTTYSEVAYSNPAKNEYIASAFAVDRVSNIVIPEDKIEIDPSNGLIRVTDCPSFMCDYVINDYYYNVNEPSLINHNVNYAPLKIGIYDKTNNSKYGLNNKITDNMKARFVGQNTYRDLSTYINDSEIENFQHKLLGNYIKPRVMWFERIVPDGESFKQTEDEKKWKYTGSNLRLHSMSGVHISCVDYFNYSNFSTKDAGNYQANVNVHDLYIPYIDNSRLMQISHHMPFEAEKETVAQAMYDYKLADESKSYLQELKSIHNIGGFAGSLVYNYGNITNNEVVLNNNIQYFIKIKKNEAGEDYIAYDGTSTHDYSMLNRYGTLAAVCEMNSNISSDGWSNTDWPLNVKNNKFKYDEKVQKVIDNVLNIGPMQLSQWETFGVASPLIAEVKPTYLAVPSIISYNASPKHISWDGNKNSTEIKTNNQYGYGYFGLFTNDMGLKWDNADDYVYTYNQNIDMPSINAWNKEHPELQKDPDDMKKYQDNWFDTDISKMICKMIDWKSNQVYMNNFGYVQGDLNPNYEEGQPETVDKPFFNNPKIIEGAGYKISDNPLKTITYTLNAEDLQYNFDVLQQKEKKRKRSWLTRLCNVTLSTVYSGSEGLIGTGIYELLTPTTKKVQGEIINTYDAFQRQKKSSLFPYFGSSLNITSAHKMWYDCNPAGANLEETDPLLQNVPSLWDGNIDLTERNKTIHITEADKHDIFQYQYNMSEKDLNVDGTYKKFDKLKFSVSFKRDLVGTIGYWLDNNDSYYTKPGLYLGVDKKPEDIREEIRNSSAGITYTSSVSGNDFQGLFVTDARGNNVMYIETEVGDLNGYSVWKMPLYTYKGLNNKDLYNGGLLLEIK